MADTLLVHATTVAIDNRAVLLRGPSGSGKSDLALRLIDAGARLVADDRSELRRDGDAILVSAPQTIAGLIEVRGIGILRVDFLASVRLSLVVDLVAPQAVERMPEQLSETILGLAVPVLALSPFEASAPAKLRFALDVLTGGGATRIRR
jgi:serine kinase of HPr protein (carbohydrate metabolism regulator)